MTLAVFTDLDGTLLDHSSYSFQAARPALALLAKRNIPLILASSKTTAEIVPLHKALNLGDLPAIVENGAGMFDPSADRPIASNEYDTIRNVLAEMPKNLRHHFSGFGDMTPNEVAAITSLSEDAAIQAKDRHFSEPGIWNGSNEARLTFEALLQSKGVVARSGGRFLTLSFGRTKADAMRHVVERIGATKTIALGDAPNDIEMLESADIGIIVRNDHGTVVPPLDGEETGKIRRTELSGPQGWNAAVLELLRDHAT